MLVINNINKTFYPNTVNEVKALRNISLTLNEGCFAAIIGTNGSGKSTLLNAVAGTFLPDSGTIMLNNKEISKWPEFKRADLIGRVFQNPFAGSAAGMSIAENIVLAMKRGQKLSFTAAINKKVKDEIADRIRLLKMGLENRLDNPIGTLSGGQRQALTLLMATWLKPKLLLLDEHTAALDPKSAAKIAELTKLIIEKENLTALMVTHSMQQAVDLPHRIIMMHKGEIVDDISGEMKKRVRTTDLVESFERIQKLDLFDESVSDLMKREYV